MHKYCQFSAVVGQATIAVRKKICITIFHAKTHKEQSRKAILDTLFFIFA